MIMLFSLCNLLGNTMILEAHISSVNKDGTSIPVMALPPTTASDLTLDQWLREVVKFHKGIKLTFKHLDAISPSIEILQKYIDDVCFIK